MSLVGSRDMCLRCVSPLTQSPLTPQSSSSFPVTAPGSSHAQLSVFFSNLLLSQMLAYTTHSDFQGHEQGSTLSNPPLAEGYQL